MVGGEMRDERAFGGVDRDDERVDSPVPLGLGRGASWDRETSAAGEDHVGGS